MKVFNSKLRFLSKIGLVCLGLSIVFACKENNEPVTENNTINLGSEGASYLKFANIPLDHVNATIANSLKGEGYEKPINTLTTSLSSESFNKILSKTVFILGLDNNTLVKPSKIVFYLKNEGLTNIETKDIAGVSVWIPQTENISQHILYRLNEKETFIIDSTYTTLCGTILKRDISYLATSVLQNNNSVNWVGYIEITKTKNLPKDNKSVIDNRFSQLVINNANSLLSGKASLGCAGYGSCGPASDTNYCEFPSPGDPPICVDGGCLLENSIKEGEKTNKTARIAQVFDLEKIREIRDKYMIKTKKGKEYVDYYYKMSQINDAFNVININNAYEHLTVAQKLMELIETLVSGRESEIVIDKNDKEKYLALINSYKSVTKNKEFQSMLKTVESDIINLTSKNKESVIKYIQ